MSDIYITSEYRVTWDPDGEGLVLLDYDERMLAEIQLPQSHAVVKHKHFRADNLKIWGRGGVSFYFRFSAVKEYDTAEDARDEMFRQSVILQALRDGVLQVEVRNGATFQYSAAAIEGAAPQMVRNSVRWSHEVPCSGLSEVGGIE
ncbi:hypothetical protein [Rubritalea sp.]|uniref:hypothetical protein n=1 Tax=Rubritalea sp. TaxID=2109375 RepID=UPI003EF98859